MRQLDVVVTPTEFKFVSDSAPGTFEGYGAVFNTVDSHKDLILPGAFKDSLAKHKSAGTMPGLYVEHSAFAGGDPLPAGVWTGMSEDAHGLKVEGKISALDTDHGKRIRSLMQDGAMGGLSIAYDVPPGGAVIGKKQGEPRRTLHKINLHAVDIVRDPSNNAARISQLKATFRAHLKDAGGPGDPNDDDTEVFEGPDVEDAIEAIAAAIILQDAMMSGGDCSPYYSGPKNSALLMDRLRDGYEALTGDRAPEGLVGWTKSNVTLRATEKLLREEFSLSHTRARDVAKRVLGSLPREEGTKSGDHTATKSALNELGESLAGFNLPKF